MTTTPMRDAAMAAHDARITAICDRVRSSVLALHERAWLSGYQVDLLDARARGVAIGDLGMGTRLGDAALSIARKAREAIAPAIHPDVIEWLLSDEDRAVVQAERREAGALAVDLYVRYMVELREMVGRA